MAIYTNDDWELDGTFSADPGQEIEESIYEYFFNCMPPLYLSTEDSAGYDGGFLMGEMYDYKDGPLHMAFGRKDKKCYYIGLKHPA